MHDQPLLAVNDDDLVDLLKSIGYMERLEAGELFCAECGTPVSLTNLQFIVPMTDSQFKFVCRFPKCVDKYLGI
jgi:hypothetical protein